MRTFLALALLGTASAAQEPGNPDLAYKKDLGISIQKPPKNEEWAFRESGLFKDPALCVTHKVDTVRIEILAQIPPPNAIVDVKAFLESHWKNLSGQEAFKDPKQPEFKKSPLPGNVGGGQTWSFTTAFSFNGTPTEYKAWNFVGRENRILYIVTVSGDEGSYKKHQKIVDLMLSSIRTWKLPK